MDADQVADDGKAADAQLQVVAPRGVARRFDAPQLVAEWQEYMGELVASGERAANTAITYTRGMDKFLAWLTGQDVARVGPQVIRRWRAALARNGAKASTVNTWYSGVRDFFRWATNEGGLAYDPCATIRAVGRRGRGHQRQPLTDHEVLRVLHQPDISTTAGSRDAALLHCLAYLGLRAVEVVRALLEDVHGDRLAVYGKGHTQADQHLRLVHPDLLEALYSWLAIHPRRGEPVAPLFCSLSRSNYGQALSTASVRRLVKGYYRAAGVVAPDKTTHSLRHSLVTNLIRHKVPPTKIMAVTRHKSLDTLLAYAHEVDRDEDPAEAYVDYRNSD